MFKGISGGPGCALVLGHRTEVHQAAGKQKAHRPPSSLTAASAVPPESQISFSEFFVVRGQDSLSASPTTAVNAAEGRSPAYILLLFLFALCLLQIPL